MRTTNLAIIGAGPYGLSISAHLRACGIYHEIFGQPMNSWRHNMPTGMKLRSEPHASSLWDPERQHTLQAFCSERGLDYQPSGRPLGLADFLDYTEWFQRHAVPDVEQLVLSRIARARDGFCLEFSNGQMLWAKNAIIATGHLPFRNVPAALSHLPTELVSHSVDHRDLARFHGKEVLVVGAGQSGLETAALLHEQGANVRLVMRGQRVKWNPAHPGERAVLSKIVYPEAGLGFGWRNVAVSQFPTLFYLLPNSLRNYIVSRSHGPSGGWWLKERVAGLIPILTALEIERAFERRQRLQLIARTEGATRVLEADHVIAATGFKPDLRRLSFLDQGLMTNIKGVDGIPRLSLCGESSVPGLFFVGLLTAPTFGPVMRFMFGAKHIAPALARRFSARGAWPSTLAAPAAARN
ncbi:NAD(P)-binding domain-containing protein [Bradyrhizobium sp. STM 3557]|uniref:NAD(P)-binding domain-containing protein n=1 Tax=Bradyrhizobium sp. STM 3557 TaxID=578920 RepID=UPI003890D2E3